MNSLAQPAKSESSELKDTFAYEVDDSNIIYRSGSSNMIGYRIAENSYQPTNINFEAMFSDEKTRVVFKKVLEHVRNSRAVVSFPYRCDTELFCKYFRLTVSISSAKHVLFFNKLLGSDSRPNGVAWRRIDGVGPDAISLCSICNRLLVNQQWQEFQALVDSNLWVVSETEMPCSFTVCEFCEQGIDQRIHQSLKFSQS